MPRVRAAVPHRANESPNDPGAVGQVDGAERPLAALRAPTDVIEATDAIFDATGTTTVPVLVDLWEP